MWQELHPCAPAMQWFHVIIAALGSITTVLTTWLTVRARRKDKEEANGNGHDARNTPLA